MAKNDMRLSVDFVDHPKTKRLIRQVGFEGIYCLLKLFSTASKIFQNGVLKNCDEHDVEDICGWSGAEGLLFSALSDEKIGFIEVQDGEFCIHDWEDEQPWVFHSNERSEQAKEAANSRWKKTKNTIADTQDTVRMRNALLNGNFSNAPYPTPTPTPIPTPYPNPNPIPKKEKENKSEADAVFLGGMEESGFKEAMKAFVAFRRQIKKPMTEKAVSLALGQLEKLPDDASRIDCVNDSIMNGWQGLFPERPRKRESQPRTRYKTEPGKVSVDDFNNM